MTPVYKPLRTLIASQLVTAIFSEEMPSGTRLIVKNLAGRYGVSSTPVREAIVFLESVGLVEFEHNRGAVVKDFGRTELREIYQLRRILEVEATRAACARLNRAEVEAIMEEMDTLKSATSQDSVWSEQVMSCDRRLHNLIAANCGSKRLADEIARYDTFMQAIRQLVGNRRHTQEIAIREHLDILTALLQNDPYVAGSEMSKHIDRTAQSVAEVLFRNGVQAKHQ